MNLLAIVTAAAIRGRRGILLGVKSSNRILPIKVDFIVGFLAALLI